MYVFTQPIRHGLNEPLSQFVKHITTCLIPEFLFSLTICITKAKELSLPELLPITEKED